MAFDISKLAKIAGGNGFSLWVYRTTDAAADVDTSGYMSSAAAMLQVGDVIVRQTYASTAYAAITTLGFHFVASNDGTTVDLADTLAVTATDTD